MKDALKTIAMILGGVALCLVALTVIFAAFSKRDPDSDPEVVEARQHVDDVTRDIDFEYQRKIRELELQSITAEFGEDTANLYVRCTSGDPPRKKRNQERCEKLLARVKRSNDYYDAQRKTEQKNW